MCITVIQTTVLSGSVQTAMRMTYDGVDVQESVNARAVRMTLDPRPSTSKAKAEARRARTDDGDHIQEAS